MGEDMDLTPEDRERIYLEERARLEAREPTEAAGERTGVGTFLGRIVLGIISLLVVLWIIGSAMQRNQEAEFNALTPEQKHERTVSSCMEIERDWAFKMYSELTPEERRTKFSCDAILSAEGGNP